MTSSQKLLEAIENLEIAKNDPEFKCWAEQELQQDKHLRILTSGKTGSGKSTLLNGIVGSKFVVGHSLKPETKTVNAHEYSLGNLKVTAWDSPGLQDGTIDEQAYIKDIIEKTTAAGGIDLLLYCIRMDETRSDLHLHASAIQKLTKCNKNIWENAIVVLTFANQYEYQLSLSTEKDQIESSFNARVEDWRQTVCDELSRMGVSTDKIRCQPAGYHSLPHLPGRQYWASLLWAHAFAALKDRSKTVLLTLNADRMDFASETGQNDSQKTLEDQKIRVTSRFLKIIAENKAAVVLGCGAGGAVIGTAGTAVVGSTMGGTAAVAGGTAAVAGGTAAVAGGTAAVVGSTAAVAGGTAAVAGGTAAVAGGTAAVAGSTAAVAGGTAAVVGSTAAVAGSTAAVAGSTAAVAGSTAAVAGGTAAVAGGTAAVAGGIAAVAGGTAAVAGSTAAVAGGTAAVAGGTAAVVGGTAAVAGGTAAVAGGTAAVAGGTAAVVGGTAAVAGGTSAVVGGTAAVAGSTAAAAGGTAAAAGGTATVVGGTVLTTGLVFTGFVVGAGIGLVIAAGLLYLSYRNEKSKKSKKD